jgi:hypothetical protein
MIPFPPQEAEARGDCFPSGPRIAKTPKVFPPPPLRRLAWLGALVFATLTGACSEGGGGDPTAAKVADEFGNCYRLAQIGGPATWQNPADTMSDACKPPPDRHVCISGVTIVAIDRFDETGKGARGNYYVEDTAEDADHSGMTIFAPSFSPPDLRLAEGDVADILGEKTEFLGPPSGRFGGCRTLPEIGGTMSFRFDGNHALAARVIPVADLKSYDTARKHLGKLVKIENVTIAGDGAKSGGRYTADIDVGGGIPQSDVPRISNELFDLEHYSGSGGDGLAMGMTFQSITGIVTYFYGFKIAPRSAADLAP